MSGQLVLDGLILCSDVAIGGTFVALFQKLRTTKSSAGISLQTLVAIVSARCLHLGSHGFGMHYRPVELPLLFFTIMDVLNSLAGMACLSLFALRYHTYEEEKDNFGIQLFEGVRWLPKWGGFKYRPVAAASFIYFLVAIVAFIWYFIRDVGHSYNTFLMSYYTCYYEALGAVALVPQLWMFHQDKRVSPIMGTFVVLVALGRVFTLTFWVAFPIVHPFAVPANRRIQIASETVNLLILSDFLFYWARSKMRGEKDIILPM